MRTGERSRNPGYGARPTEGPVTVMSDAHGGPAAGGPGEPAVANAEQGAGGDGPAAAHRTRHAAGVGGETAAPNERLPAPTRAAPPGHGAECGLRDGVAGAATVPRPRATGPHPFSLADPAVAGGILAAAGFTDVSFTDVHEPVYYGPDTAVALDVVGGLRSTRELLAGMDAAAAE